MTTPEQIEIPRQQCGHPFTIGGHKWYCVADEHDGGDHDYHLGAEFFLALAASEAIAWRDQRIADLIQSGNIWAEKCEASARALELPLMFHSGGIWTPEKSARWKEITGTEEATTTVMCDAIRAALASPPA